MSEPKSMETMSPCYGCGIPMPTAPDAKDWEICDSCKEDQCPGCGGLGYDGEMCFDCAEQLAIEQKQAEITEEML